LVQWNYKKLKGIELAMRDKRAPHVPSGELTTHETDVQYVGFLQRFADTPDEPQEEVGNLGAGAESSDDEVSSGEDDDDDEEEDEEEENEDEEVGEEEEEDAVTILLGLSQVE
jgi:hypothetical protein